MTMLSVTRDRDAVDRALSALAAGGQDADLVAGIRAYVVGLQDTIDRGLPCPECAALNTEVARLRSEVDHLAGEAGRKGPTR